MTRTTTSRSMTALFTLLRVNSAPKRSVISAAVARCATLLFAAAVSLSLGSLSQAGSLTWTNSPDATGIWNETDDNWSGDSTKYTDGSVDDVEFDGTAPGTITIQTGGVTANSMLHSGGTHEFTGGASTDTLKTTPITLSGGILQYDGLSRLGTGQINVTGNATIEATGTSAQTGMSNSGIVVTDGVTLSLDQNNGGSDPTGTTAPISGGGGTPITVSINPAGGTKGFNLSPGSTFTGDIDLGGRTYFTPLTSSMFGSISNTINGSLEARLAGGGGTVDQDINHTGGDSHWSGTLTNTLILNGQVNSVGGELTGGTIRFTKAGNSLGSWSTNQGHYLEFAHDGDIGFSNLSSNGPDNSANGFAGKTIRWVGAGLSGSASTNWTLQSYGAVATSLTGNIDVVDATSTVDWTGDWRTNTTNSTQQFEKEGLGTVNWSGDSTGPELTVINVNAGTLNINGTPGNLGNITVNNGAILGGIGTITVDGGSAVTVNSGGAIAPGLSPGTLTLNGDLTLLDGSFLNIEVGPISDLLVVNGTLTGAVSVGGVTIDVTNLGADIVPIAILDWTGGSASGVELSDFQLLDPDGGTLSISGSQLLFTAAVPEPSSLLLLGLGMLGLVRHTRRRKSRA